MAASTTLISMAPIRQPSGNPTLVAPGRRGSAPSTTSGLRCLALCVVSGQDLRAYTDGELWLHRSGYERETAWAPPYLAEEFRLMRVALAQACAARRRTNDAMSRSSRSFARRVT